jgi:plasmid stability protein
MRTTVRIDDALLAEVKEYAARHNRSVTSVLEDALRALLSRYESEPVRSPVRLDIVWGDGLMPGVQLDSSARLQEFLDEDDQDRFRTEPADATC